MSKIFDSHAHYDSKQFDDDRAELLERLPAMGVGWVVNAASDLESAQKCVRLSETFDYIYAAVGVHPHGADGWNDESEKILRELAKAPKVVAVGEIGLDYHYDFSPRDVQKEVFERQINIAKELSLPIIIHDREAHGDMYEILRKYAPLTGVMHCFSGSVELARETLSIGLHIGLGGAVTFKNARVPVEVAAMVPEDRLLIETDCPYMAPVPKRGSRCDSSMISITAQRIAEIRGCTAEDIIELTAKNASRLFSVDI